MVRPYRSRYVDIPRRSAPESARVLNSAHEKGSYHHTIIYQMLLYTLAKSTRCYSGTDARLKRLGIVEDDILRKYPPRVRVHGLA